ncbi:MAG: replicative DNA helicase [Candidatus Nomurabacteria bacterium]|nr:MAG: replicative DNA helicase [Candidatus Nomurabacteria bacterium]
MPQEIIPPQNIEAEQATLGSLLIDKDAIIKIADQLRPEDFYKDTHRMIFEAMLELYAKQEPIDILSLTNRLNERKQLEMIGGRSYLAELSNAVATASNIVHHSNIVQRKATLRRLIGASQEINALGYKETDEVDILLDQAEQRLFEVSQKYMRQQFISLQSALSDAFERIDELHKQSGTLRGLPTGYTDLDNILAGLQRSDLIILAARPSVGKTSLAMDLARNVAIKSKQPVGIFSLEMSKEQLVDRMICAEAGVSLWKMRTGKLSSDEQDDDFPRIGHAIGTLSEAQIFIDDSAVTSVMEMRTKARRLKTEHGLGLLVVDYLQLMEGRVDSESRVQQVAEITRGLKGIAKELDVPVLALSQLSRAVESRTPPIPKLADLRESGSIEQDADVVMFIYREALYKPETDRRNVAEIHIAKHRNGPTGIVQMFFDENTVSFKNLETRVQEPF